jgi:hypothetical protein
MEHGFREPAVRGTGGHTSGHRGPRELSKIFRALNERIGRVVPISDDRYDFFCECGNDGCTCPTPMTAREYEDLHAERGQLTVLPGHERPALEEVVQRTSAYVVVRRLGAEEVIR